MGSTKSGLTGINHNNVNPVVKLSIYRIFSKIIFLIDWIQIANHFHGPAICVALANPTPQKSQGDTAFRSARLTIADSFNFKQEKLLQRFYITIPMFAIALLLTQIDFGIVWRYFGWANQTLAVFVLWTAAVYMKQTSGKYWFVLVPSSA